LQASNTDAYFAVTGHWIEEPTSGAWKKQSALLVSPGSIIPTMAVPGPSLI